MAEFLAKSKESIISTLTAATDSINLNESKSYCVDESTGSDLTGDGSPTNPYASVGGVFIAHGDSVTALVRQKKEGEGAGEVVESWEPATASAIKRGKKAQITAETKAKKAEELRKKDELEGEAKRAKEQARMEEAKKIVLVQPTTEATKIKLRQAVESRGKRVRIFGWVHRLRQQGGMTFIVLRDGTGYLQCVLTGDLVSPEFLLRSC